MTLDQLMREDSTVRLTYEALLQLGRSCQVQIAQQIKRTPSAVCKSLKVLIEGGFAKAAGTEPNARGSGKPLHFYESTGKRITDENTAEALNEQAELIRIMHGFVHLGDDEDKKE